MIKKIISLAFVSMSMLVSAGIVAAPPVCPSLQDGFKIINPSSKGTFLSNSGYWTGGTIFTNTANKADAIKAAKSAIVSATVNGYAVKTAISTKKDSGYFYMCRGGNYKNLPAKVIKVYTFSKAFPSSSSSADAVVKEYSVQQKLEMYKAHKANK